MSARSKSNDRDERFMKLALQLARRGRGRTEPNPRVGSVVVHGDEVIGRGYHRRAGGDHAEIGALKDSGSRASGAELYVNLEPCCHKGLTGPCVEAILGARISRVVIGMIDPNPLVCGKGIERLRAAGVEVRAGVLEQQCREENRAFITYVCSGRPHVTFKSAMTLDGRVAARNGHARWVTGEKARAEGHRLRHLNQAIVVGVGTLLADDPQLTCRVSRGRDPIRIIVDSQLRTPPSAKVVAQAAGGGAPTWVVTTTTAARDSARRLAKLQKAGVEVLPVRSKGGRVSIPAMLSMLARRQVVSLLLEGGPTLAGAFWQARLVDEVVAFVAPKVLADPVALPMLFGGHARTMDEATPLQGVKVRRVGEDLMVTGRVFSSGPGCAKCLPG